MISIVMAYYNRQAQLGYTLKTIGRSSYKDVEIVIVDDFSAADQQPEPITDQFPELNFNIIHMHDRVEKKSYCNPCVPYNTGFRASKGDKIIIQNPECCHMGDVVAYTADMLTDDAYLSYHAYGCTKQDLKFLHADEPVPMFSHKKARWYNHATERPFGFHFCNAITRNNLIKINGFDEAYSQGHNYDDAEILHRIKNLGLPIKFVADPWVIHQYHHKSYGHPDNPQPTVDNKALYEALLKTDQVRANNPESIQ